MGLLIYSYMPISSFKARVISSAQHYVKLINHAWVVNQKINRAVKSKMIIQPSMWRNLICLWIQGVILVTLQSGIFDFGAHIPSPYSHIKINTPREPPADTLTYFFFSPQSWEIQRGIKMYCCFLHLFAPVLQHSLSYPGSVIFLLPEH